MRTEATPTGNHFWGDDWSAKRALWSLEEGVAHLNHGSYGAVPDLLLDERRRIESLVESNPDRFFNRQLKEMLDEARSFAAGFLGADAAGFAFIPNATTGANAILRSVKLDVGDEVLTTDHNYGAVLRAAQRTCEERGAVIRSVSIPLDPNDADEVVAVIMAAITERTRIAVIDQTSSPTALHFPVEELCVALRGVGVLSLIDGAHAPGSVPVDLATMAPDFWVGNFHKWCCAPRGSAGIFVASRHREMIRPPLVSWLEDDGYPDNFGWWGTDDFSAYLTVPAAIRFMQDLDLDRVWSHNSELAQYGADCVARALGTTKLGHEMRGPMSVVPLPAGVATGRPKAIELAARIARELGAEVAINPHEPGGLLRLSAQVYNAPNEYEMLAASIRSVIS